MTKILDIPKQPAVYVVQQFVTATTPDGYDEYVWETICLFGFFTEYKQACCMVSNLNVDFTKDNPNVVPGTLKHYRVESIEHNMEDHRICL